MAVLRDRPYHQFNFLVDLGSGDTEGIEAGFSECSPIAFEVAVAEYRNGNARGDKAVEPAPATVAKSSRPTDGRCASLALSLVRPQIGPYAFRDAD